MKKLYVDMSCDKISGQQKMQGFLLNEVKKRNLFTEKEDADVLVYAQIPFNKEIKNEWSSYKNNGKKIVFIHHYCDRRIYQNNAIFNIDGLLELIDLHIVISKDSDLYKELFLKKFKVIAYEQAGSNYYEIHNKHWVNFKDKDKNSICFVGRKSKGLNEFINYTSQEKFKHWKKVILTSKELDETYNLDNSYDIHIGKTNDELYNEIKKCQFLYLDINLIQPFDHMETIVHEAIPCGTIIIHGSNTRKYFKYSDDITGFIKDIDNIDYTENQIKQWNFLRKYYNTIDKIVDANIKVLLNV